MSRSVLALTLALMAMTGTVHASSAERGTSTLPPPPAPPENPITEEKRVLGKILFWEEQLSSDNTVACGTCHVPGVGGSDSRFGRHPGPDGLFNTLDDVFASPAMRPSDANDDYAPVALFGLNRQVTRRASQPVFNSAYANELFWDGRATSTFIDPQTGLVAIPSGGALESQSVEPVVSSVEMAHASRDWDQVTAKLRRSGPMALATDIPQDMADAIASHPSYPALFEAAFGDDQITAARIAFAIATYQRTLISDQSPWDRFMLGETDALTPAQQQGWLVLQNSSCLTCHTAPLFTDNQFHNIGLRPNTDDIGRESVTFDPQNRGETKTPSLRNLGLRTTFMHTGQFNALAAVFPFYAGPGAPGNPNRDPILPSPIPPPLVDEVVDFIENGLLDPRVAAESFPFDRPLLHSEGVTNPLAMPGAQVGTGGIAPRLIAISPPNVGNLEFKIGVDRALGGATAMVALSTSPPIAGVVDPTTQLGPIKLNGSGSGAGYGTAHWPIPPDPQLDGAIYFMQWRITDPAAPGGIARSDIARLTLFGGAALPPGCPGDADGSGVVDLNDLTTVLFNFGTPGPAGDLDGDNDVDLADLSTVLFFFGAAC